MKERERDTMKRQNAQKDLLVVVDMQKDFVDGALGSAAARAIVPAVAARIKQFDGDIVYTMDTHGRDYPETVEGRKLPVPHCLCCSEGWELTPAVEQALDERADAVIGAWEKETFGSVELGKFLAQAGYRRLLFVGLCTDICVISNVLLAKAFCPNAEILVDADACAGVSRESHLTALRAMQACHIDILNMPEGQ